MRRAGALALVLLASGAPAGAAGLSALDGAPPGAASCSGCHAARADARSGIPMIAGRPADEIAAALAGFRDDSRPASVMNRIASGFTEAESRAIAVWISRQPSAP